MTGKYLITKTTFFEKEKSYEISTIDIYVGKDLEFIICVFSWCVPLDHEIYTKYKKTMKNIILPNLIKVISHYNICSGIKGEQAKKTSHLSFSTKNF